MKSTEDIKKQFDTFVMPTYAPSIALVRGAGTKVWDADGKEYLDFMAGISVLNVGHSHPVVIEAICNQVRQLTHVSNLYYTENEAMLAEKLSKLSFGGKCFFANSGAEANEGLIKLARLWGHNEGRYKIITMKNSFHGRTLATAAATGQTKIQNGFEPMPKGFSYADYNNIESVAALVDDKTVAIMLEAIQGEGGIIPAEKEFMKAVRSLCDEKNLLMLCDEVQCGMARTGAWWGFEHTDVQPDAFSIAKALGSGYPIGAVISSPKYSDIFQPGKHATTFGGTPLACAAALATIQVIEEENLVERAAVAGKLFSDGLLALGNKHEVIDTVRGKGMMIGLVLNEPAQQFVNKIINAGVLCVATAGTVIRFLPPLNIKDEEIAKVINIVDECLELK